MAKPAGYRGKRIVKGLEPLIAAIILIAITLVIAIAVIAWMTGLFGTTVGGAESLVILPTASLKYVGEEWKLNLSIRNSGSSPSAVIAVYVENRECTINSPSSPPVTITPSPGTKTDISAVCGNNPDDFIAGVKYTIKVVTAAGNLFFSQVIAG
jgi:flagellin-like protein